MRKMFLSIYFVKTRDNLLIARSFMQDGHMSTEADRITILNINSGRIQTFDNSES